MENKHVISVSAKVAETLERAKKKLSSDLLQLQVIKDRCDTSNRHLKDLLGMVLDGTPHTVEDIVDIDVLPDSSEIVIHKK